MSRHSFDGMGVACLLWRCCFKASWVSILLQMFLLYLLQETSFTGSVLLCLLACRAPCPRVNSQLQVARPQKHQCTFYTHGDSADDSMSQGTTSNPSPRPSPPPRPAAINQTPVMLQASSPHTARTAIKSASPEAQQCRGPTASHRAAAECGRWQGHEAGGCACGHTTPTSLWRQCPYD